MLTNISWINKWINELPLCHWTTNSCYFFCRPSGCCHLKLISFCTTILWHYFFFLFPKKWFNLYYVFQNIYPLCVLQSSQHVALNLIVCYIQLNWYLPKWIWKFKLNIDVVLKLTDNAKDNTGSKTFSCEMWPAYDK